MTNYREEDMHLKKLEPIAKKLKRRESLQNRQLHTLLSED